MCQMSVVLGREDEAEVVAENASLLEVVADGVRISTLFEEPRLLPGVRVERIDFLNNRVILAQAEAERK